jgi:hypothetical protein
MFNDATKWVLEDLSFVYGNGGPKHTDGNHNVLQWLLGKKEIRGESYELTLDCAKAIGRTLKAYPIKHYLISEWEKPKVI